MKALSIKQPWAWLIVNGYKDIENRKWKTKFRGEVLIHAGKRMDVLGLEYVKLRFPHIKLESMYQEMGGIVGKAVIIDCVEDHPSDWFFGPYGFVLAEAEKLPFTPYKGQLSFFEVKNDR